MEKKTLKETFKSGVMAATIAMSASTGIATDANAQAVKNIVLVHGAFADGSGYKRLVMHT